MVDQILRAFRTLLEFWTRRRTVAAALLAAGLYVLGLGAGGLPDGEVAYQDSQRTFELSLRSADVLPPEANLAMLGLGTLLLLGGLGVGVVDFIQTYRLSSRLKSIIVEVRGLHSSPDTPVNASDIGLPRGAVDRQVVDFRPGSEGELVNPALALDKFAGMKRAVESACGDRAPEDITLAVGGLAAVPCMFLVGMLFDNESAVVVFDWDRNSKKWRLTDGLDDGKRMTPMDPSTVPASTGEVVLAVSLSYAVGERALQRRFGPEVPVVHLRAEEMLADRYWSLEKQQACVVAFTDAVQELMAQGIQRIHLVVAGPSSLVVRLGMAYDRRLMPELVVHQYERTSPQGYPWGLRMPTHGRLGASVEHWPAKSEDASIPAVAA